MRLSDMYNRLHAISKIEILGAFGVMLSIFVKVGFAPMGVKAITVGIFLMLTVPVSAHMISRAAHRHGVNMCEESVIDEYGETYKWVAAWKLNIKTPYTGLIHLYEVYREFKE